MAVPSYTATNWAGHATDPAGALITLIETNLTDAGWTFIEEYGFTQSATSRVMRVWKNPSTLNIAGVDFYIAFVKNVAAGTYLAMRTFEGWDAVGKTIQRPCIQGNATAIPTGVMWTSRTMPVSSLWNSVAYGGGMFVAISATSGTIAASSPDGITWTARTLPSTATWFSVTYGNGMFVAIPNNAANTAAASSPDGITWTARTMPTSATWTSVTYGGGQFVAVASGSTAAATSPDGITWTARTLPSSTTWNSVAYGGGMYVAVSLASGTIAASSPDGITWTARTLPSTATWKAVAYGNGMFVAIPSNTTNTAAASSPDGITWTARTLPSSDTWNAVAYADSKFVAIGGASSQPTATSPDGITWTTRPSHGAGSSGTALAYGAGLWVALRFNTTTSGSCAMDLTLPYHAGSGNWNPDGSTVPLMVDTVPTVTLIAATSYDVAVLASRSYLAVAVNANGTGTPKFSWVLGLCSPSYSDAQATYPPLMALDFQSNFTAATSGVSRSMRQTVGTTAFSVCAGPETITLGTFQGGVVDPVTNIIRASRVVLAGGNQNVGFSTGGGYRGIAYDMICVVCTANTVKVSDTVTVGGTVYSYIGQSAASANFIGNGTLAFFANTAAGT